MPVPEPICTYTDPTTGTVCGAPANWQIRSLSDPATILHVCGKHLQAAISGTPERPVIPKGQ